MLALLAFVYNYRNIYILTVIVYILKMVNSKKYTIDNPRVHVSTRLLTKSDLDDLFPELNTSHKKLERLIKNERTRN